MVLSRVLLDSIDDRGGPFDNQIFEAIALVQICVHVLLHSLSRKFVLLAFLVVFNLLSVDIRNHIKQLF